MAQKDTKVEVTAVPEAFESLKDQPNVVLEAVDFESDVLNNEFAGEPEGKAPEAPPQLSPEDKFSRMMEAMLSIAENTEKREARAEAIRQIPYNEILPVSPWNPTGKRDRVKLTRPTYLHGIIVNPLTHTEEEITLWNKIKPGRYIDRKVEVRMQQDGSIDLSWPGAKTDARIEFYSRFPTLASLLQAVIAEREEKEARKRRGIYTDDDSLE